MDARGYRHTLLGKPVSRSCPQFVTAAERVRSQGRYEENRFAQIEPRDRRSQHFAARNKKSRCGI